MLATRPKTMDCLHPADVGAVIDRPRATDSRPYKILTNAFVFCNTLQGLQGMGELGVFGGSKEEKA